MPLEHVVVLVPARDEEALLPRCLRSIAQARDALWEAGVASDLVVVCDASRDRSYEIASAMVGRTGIVVSASEGCVGAARALAARVAIARSAGPLENCWLANTDADSKVPVSWLVEQAALAARGIDAITGIIDVDDFAEHDAGVPGRFRSSYVVHADGTHPHVHGANLGVRADAYERAGGWAPLRHREDHDLWGRLRATGARMVSAASLCVTTSGRRRGRAPHGFAGALAAHNTAPTAGIFASEDAFLTRSKNLDHGDAGRSTVHSPRRAVVETDCDSRGVRVTEEVR